MLRHMRDRFHFISAATKWLDAAESIRHYFKHGGKASCSDPSGTSRAGASLTGLLKRYDSGAPEEPHETVVCWIQRLLTLALSTPMRGQETS